MKSTSRVYYLWVALILLTILGGILLSLLFFLPFDYQKNLIDALAADGDVESFTPIIYNITSSCSGFLSLLFWGMMIAMLALFRRAESITEAINSSIRQFFILRGREIQKLIQAIIPSKQEFVPLFFLIGITGLSIFVRYAYLWRPMGHDEAYTFMAFASRGLRYVISDYHKPNNHVFHTILVNLSYQLWGDSPPFIRLPAYLAGVLIVPTTYLVGRVFYKTTIALVSASIVASLPVLIDYSTTARGYTLLSLFTLLIVALAAFLKDHRNVIAWFLLVCLSSLGLYTNPTMIYPIGMVFTWLIISKFIGDTTEDYGKEFFAFLFFSFMLTMIFTGILYFPIIFNNGLGSIVNNEVVEALGWSDFIQSVPVRIKNTWIEWNRDLPAWVSVTALVGLAASLFVPKLPSNRRVPLILAGVLWIGTALVVQRVAPWPRIWLFLLPLFVIWITAGIIGLLEILVYKLPRGSNLMLGIVGLFILLPLLLGFVRSYNQYTQKLHSKGEVESIAVFLQDYLEPEDVVVVTSPDTIVLKYYLRRYGLKQEVTELAKDKSFTHAIVVVNLAQGQTMEYVLEKRSFSDDVRLGSAQEIYRTERFALFELSGG